MSLKNKTIFITGSALRIGRSFALTAAKNGADLIIHYNSSLADANKLKEEIEQIGQTAALVQADFSDPESTLELAVKVFSEHKVFGLINNASIFDDLTLEQTTLDKWQDHFSVNLTAPFLLSKSFAASLGSDNEGRIINILDWRALRPGPDHFPYTISKAALAALTKSLATSVAPNITVNGIALGAVLPPTDGGNTDDITNTLPIPRWASLPEIDETVMFFLTGPGYITGEIIHIDGGRHLI